MTELAVPEGNDLAPAEQNSPAVQPQQAPTLEQGNALILWAQAARQAAQIASSLAKTSFVPASLRGKPEDITAAILAGQELGLQPMATLRSMDVIQGTPALRAHAMRGLVQSRGHEIELVESTPERCVMRGRRKGARQWQQVEWDLDRAAKLQLLGKSEWKKQPQTMLVARATGEICRLVAADVLYAMPYASEELDRGLPQAEATVTASHVTGDEIRRRTAVARPAAEAALAAPVETPAAEVDEHGEAVAALYAAIDARGVDRGAVLEKFWETQGCSPEEASTEAVRAATDALGGAA